MDDLFFEIFDAKLPRLGPGLSSTTIDTFNKLPIENKSLKILDVGCGNGAQTIELASIADGEITAVDFYPQFIDELNRRSMNNGFGDKIKTKLGDMYNLQLPEGTFDIIWCEGAIFIMGFEKGLAELKKFVKPGGIMVVSDMVNFSDSNPSELQEFFDSATPDIKKPEEVIELINNYGFELLNNFKLPDDGWDEFYAPIIPYLEKFEKKYEGNEKALMFSKMVRYEIDIFSKYKKYYGYMFFILKKPCC